MPQAPIGPELTLAYRAHGPDDAPVLLLITGLGGLKEGWFRQEAGLSDAFRVVSFDNRGVGGSTVVDAPLAMVDLAGDAVRLLDHLGLDRAHVWGVSMGGAIAQELALGWPERVDRLVLENTHAGGRFREGSPLRDAHGASAEVWYETIVPLLFGRPYREANDRMMRAFARSRERNPPDPVGMARLWEAYDAFDAWDRLPALATETLVLVGADDALCDPASGVELSERLPNAALHVVEHGGHSVHIELPDAVNAAVRAFLTD